MEREAEEWRKVRRWREKQKGGIKAERWKDNQRGGERIRWL